MIGDLTSVFHSYSICFTFCWLTRAIHRSLHIYGNSSREFMDLYAPQSDRFEIYPPPPPSYFESLEQLNGDVIVSPASIDLRDASPSYYGPLSSYGTGASAEAVSALPPTYEDAMGSPI